MTIREIAKLSGVSISTVSKIVNQKDQNINPKTRERVLQIVKEYNYSPYSTVKNISFAKTFLIGILLRDTPSGNPMLNGILKTAQAHGYSIVLLNSDGDPKTELRHISNLCRLNADGVIWEPAGSSSIDYEHYFSEQHIPVCYINGFEPDTSYGIDYEQMGFLLTQKLIDYKHSKIACLLKRNSRRSQKIFSGFRQCLFKNQISFDEQMEIYADDDSFRPESLVERFSGVISADYPAALRFYEQITALHYHIPSDLSLVTLKEYAEEGSAFPHIAGIRIPYEEFGSYICKEIIARCEKSSGETDSFLFPAESSFDTEDSLEMPCYFRSKKIVVVGSINLDYTFVVNQLPQSGQTTLIQNITTSFGGKGANQAVGAAKLGREVSLIGEVGNDTDANFILDTLEKERIDTRGVHRYPHSSTGKAYIYIEKDGEGTITIFPGANTSLTPEDIYNRQFLFKKAGYCLLSTELHVSTICAAAETAKKYGVQTILKPSTLHSFPKELAAYIDILVPNRKEAAVLCPACQNVEEQADYLFSLDVPTVIITLGHDGCYLRTKKTGKFFPASDFVAVDTTGGADAFISALAAYLIEGYGMEEAIQIATYAAGFCISRQGAASTIDRQTLDTHIRRSNPHLLSLKME